MSATDHVRVKQQEESEKQKPDVPDTDVIISGSNAKMLSSDLTTLIGGRYKEIYIQPLSYLEFLQFHNLQDSDESLAKYMKYGGLPGLVKTGLDEDDVREYHSDVYNTVLLKDVILRHEIRNVQFLENLVRFLADNSGQIHKVNRFDIHGKRLFENNDKFYFEDHGLRNTLAGGTRENDIEKVVENIVFQQLVRLGYTVKVGKLPFGEIDFVCSKSNVKMIYVQASYLIATEETRRREFGNLKSIKDNYPKYVISMNPLLTKSDYDGITHIGLKTFLTEGV